MDMLPTPIARDGVGGAHPTDGDVRLTEGKTYQPFSASLKDLGAAMLLPTPLVVEREHPERVEALRATGARNFHARPEKGSDAHPNGIVDFMNFYGMLPTPQAMDGTEIKSKMGKNDVLVEKPSGIRRKVQTGSDFGVSLGFMATNKMLPTPTAIEGQKYTNTFNPNSQMGQSLSAMAGSGMLPTPEEEDIGLLMQQDAESVGLPSRLSPLFTEEMMGFPFLWTTLPFLRPSGAPKPSKPTATP